MTDLYVTIDTEYAAGVAARGAIGAQDRLDNFRMSIAGETPGGAVGISYQMDVLERHGLKAVFFVDPMPALVWGTEAITDIVEPIVTRGHDVQLHVHSEWLEISGARNPLGRVIGQNLGDFTFGQQCEILTYARDALMAAGAPKPIAFRAGNYGANDDTLRALAKLGFTHDTSHCPGITGSACRISLGADDRLPAMHEGVVEVPIGCIRARGDRLRHFQLTALTERELIVGLRHAERNGQASMTLVSHSFELLSRDRSKINHIVKRRFERFCAAVEGMAEVDAVTYRDKLPQPHSGPIPQPLPHSALRTGMRFVEQACANALYGAR